MRPAGVDETINVIADAPLLDIQRTNVSNVFDQDVIQNLPLNGRRWDQFVMLSPGVTNDGTFGLISYRGISGLYNNNMVDGVDNNQAFFSEARGRTRAVYSISESAIKEFQVGVSNMSAEFGRAAGGTVNAVTKSGSNAFSGEGSISCATRPSSRRIRSLPTPFWDRLTSAGSSSGCGSAVRSRKTSIFFFVDYDQQVRKFPPYVNTSSVDASTASLHRTSAANCAATTAFLPLARGAEPARSEQQGGAGDASTGRSTGRTTLSISYNGQRWNSPNGINTGAVLTLAEFRQRHRHRRHRLLGVINWNTVLSPSWLNELRVQLGRDYEEQTPNGDRPGHHGHRRHRLRHAELSAAAGVPARAALPDPRQRHATSAARTR